MARSILREYLLKIGFEYSDKEWKQIQKNADATTSALTEIATTAVAAATAIGAATIKTATGLERLYYSAQRVHSSVKSLQAFQFGAEQIGVSAENAQSAVEGLAKVLRNSPGRQGQLLSFGINPNQDPTKIIEKLVQLTSKMPHYIGAQLMQGFGIDEETFTMLSQPGALDKLKSGEATRLGQMARDKVDPDKVALQSKDMMNDIRTFGGTVQDAKEKLAERFIPAVDGTVKALDKLTAQVGKLDEATGGWSTRIGGAAIGIGAAEIAKFGLKYVGKKLLGTAAKGAAGEAAGAAGEAAGAGGALGAVGALVAPLLVGVAAAYAAKKFAIPQKIDKLLSDHGINPTAGGGTDDEKKQMWASLFNKTVGGAKQLGAIGLDQFIKFNEGYKGYTYGDQAGHATIGYGHKLRPGEQFGPGFDKNDASRLFGGDVAAAVAAVKRLVKVQLNSNQLKGLADLDFNIGDKNFGNSTLLKKLNSGDYAGASNEFAKWNKVHTADGVIASGGLTARRARDKAMFDQAPQVNQKTEIIVKGSEDANATARAVAKQQNKVNSDMVRNLAGVIDTTGN